MPARRHYVVAAGEGLDSEFLADGSGGTEHDNPASRPPRRGTSREPPGPRSNNAGPRPVRRARPTAKGPRRGSVTIAPASAAIRVPDGYRAGRVVLPEHVGMAGRQRQQGKSRRIGCGRAARAWTSPRRPRRTWPRSYCCCRPGSPSLSPPRALSWRTPATVDRDHDAPPPRAAV